MRKITISLILLFVILIVAFFTILVYYQELNSGTTTLRVPAEWEPHAATWMQWPRGPDRLQRLSHVEIIDILQDYEPVNIIVNGDAARDEAQESLLNHGVPLTNITWFITDYYSSWMRDNGPVYAVDQGSLLVQNWSFDGWGDLDFISKKDDRIPGFVAGELGLRCDEYDLIVERGTLEFNGKDTLITSWAVLHDRNPEVTRYEMEQLFRQAFGITKIVWLEHGPPGDLTKGHVDGITRFINETTVVVPQFIDSNDSNAWVYDEAASIVKSAGFDVVRMAIPGYVEYHGVQMYANYVNWLVANGVVIMTGFGHQEWDEDARQTLEGYFPGRDVYVVNTLALWFKGGGVHCVTNDQPAS